MHIRLARIDFKQISDNPISIHVISLHTFLMQYAGHLSPINWFCFTLINKRAFRNKSFQKTMPCMSSSDGKVVVLTFITHAVASFNVACLVKTRLQPVPCHNIRIYNYIIYNVIVYRAILRKITLESSNKKNEF